MMLEYPSGKITESSEGFEPSFPNYTNKFWTPIGLKLLADPVVTLCVLDFQKYAKSPHSYSMFKSLVAVSNCHSDENTRIERLSKLRRELSPGGEQGMKLPAPLEPAGFIFHESRVGSTLATNLLASDPSNMVFSESDPPATVLLHFDEHDNQKEEKIALFRDIVLLMGRSTVHKRYFFKFQSITSTKMFIALEVCVGFRSEGRGSAPFVTIGGQSDLSSLTSTFL